MSLRDDILALTATLGRLSRIQDPRDSSNCTEGSSDDTISAVSAVVEDGGVRDSCLSTPYAPVSVPADRRSVNDNDTSGLLNVDDTTALPPVEPVPDRHGHGVNSEGARFPAGAGRPVRGASPPPPKMHVGHVSRGHSRAPAYHGDNKDASCLETPLSESCGASTESSGQEPSVSQVEEAYKKIARRLLSEIQRLDFCIAEVSARCVDDRREFLHTRRELQEQLLERDALIGTLQHQLKLKGTAETTYSCCCFSGAINPIAQQHITPMTSSGHVTSRSCSGSGVPTTVAACCRPTGTAGAQQSVDYKAFGMCSSFSRSAAREELVSTSRSCSPVVASRHGGDATAVPHAAVCAEGSVAPAPCGSSPTVLASAAPSLGGDERPSESEVGVVRATKNVTHVGSATVRHVDACVQSDAMSEVPGLTSKYYSCRKPLVLPEGHQNVGIGISPKELRLGFDESRKCTPLRHSDRSRHTQGTVAVAPRVGPVRCPACSQSNFVQPVHQRGIRHNNATNTLSSSPLFAAAGGASAGNSRGQAGRSCNLPASFNQAKVHQHSRPRPPAATSVTRRKGRLPKVSRRGDDVVDVLAAKSAFLEAGLRDVMERLDEHQSELHNVTCLLHKLVLSSTHCGP